MAKKKSSLLNIEPDKPPAKTELEPLKTEVLSNMEVKLLNTLKTVAQMRKAQIAFFSERHKGNSGQAFIVESKRLEAAVDLRLGELGIRAE